MTFIEMCNGANMSKFSSLIVTNLKIPYDAVWSKIIKE